MRSTARNDVKCHAEDNSPKYRMVGNDVGLKSPTHRSFKFWYRDFCSSLRANAKQSRETVITRSDKRRSNLIHIEKDEIATFRCTPLAMTDKRLRNKCAIVCDLFPRPFGERVRERGYLAAFTLAEVLITLGIIGVVAAMTMPTLINNINNKANINKLKREYSLFQQAFQQIAADNDLEFKNAVADCPDSTKHACLKDIFKSKLKTVADCDSNDGDNLGKCFVQDKDAKKLNGEAVPLSAGYFNQNTTSGLVLDDGASAAIWLDAMDCTNALSSVKQRCGWFVIDVNGPQKRPNTWGKDLFLFFLYADQIMPADENTTDYANYRDDCETGTNYGLTCASKYLFK